jgi:hypothetical protein
MNWLEVNGNWVLLPLRPLGVIHFLGGAFVAAAPQTTYRRLLEFLANQGYAVVATPFINTFDHRGIARTVLNQFRAAIEQLEQSQLEQSRLPRYLPIYGLGHSMGCKLHLLIGSFAKDERAGNILLSFNNYSSNQAIPFMDSLNLASTFEFTPSPEETNRLVQERYQVRRNLLVRFANDNIDQTLLLKKLLQERFGETVAARQLPGNHLTPLGQDLSWQAGGEFSPFDALGQWMRQELFRELAQLEQAILEWLDPSIRFRSRSES